MKCKLITNPSQEELESVKKWLFDEYMSLNCESGFYCNWDTIEQGYYYNNVFLFSLDNEPIGLVLWNGKGCANIDIFVINPEKRHLGIGNQCIKLLCNYFKKKSIFVVELYCEPEESVSFWQGKLGFVKSPKRYDGERQKYYKPLISTATTYTDMVDFTDKLELWYSHFDDQKSPKLKWNLNEISQRNPIIQPCYGDWFLRLTQNNSIIEQCVVKNFDQGRYFKDGFLYVKKLKGI